MEYGQAMIVVWRRYGIISRKKYLRVLNILFHIKYSEKTWTLNTTARNKKIKVRKAYNRRKLGEHHLRELKQLSKQLLAAKETSKETFLDQYEAKKVNAHLSSTSM